MKALDQNTINTIITLSAQGVSNANIAKRAKVSLASVQRKIRKHKAAVRSQRAHFAGAADVKRFDDNERRNAATTGPDLEFLERALHAKKSFSRKSLRRDWQKNYPPPYPWKTVVSNEDGTVLAAWLKAARPAWLTSGGEPWLATGAGYADKRGNGPPVADVVAKRVTEVEDAAAEVASVLDVPKAPPFSSTPLGALLERLKQSALSGASVTLNPLEAAACFTILGAHAIGVKS